MGAGADCRGGKTAGVDAGIVVAVAPGTGGGVAVWVAIGEGLKVAAATVGDQIGEGARVGSGVSAGGGVGLNAGCSAAVDVGKNGRGPDVGAGTGVAITGVTGMRVASMEAGLGVGNETGG